MVTVLRKSSDLRWSYLHQVGQDCLLWWIQGCVQWTDGRTWLQISWRQSQLWIFAWGPCVINTTASEYLSYAHSVTLKPSKKMGHEDWFRTVAAIVGCDRFLTSPIIPLLSQIAWVFILIFGGGQHLLSADKRETNYKFLLLQWYPPIVASPVVAKLMWIWWTYLLHTCYSTVVILNIDNVVVERWYTILIRNQCPKPTTRKLGNGEDGR